MKTLGILTKRNIKLFFKDKGLFFTSLITPIILLVLYATFLGNVYESTLLSIIPKGLLVDERVVSGYVGAQLISSILAVSCVTIAFCSNMLMVQDKVTGSILDLRMSPISPSTLSLSYYLATLSATLIICLTAFGICLVYIAFLGWYLSFVDCLLLVVDIILLTLFGTALSSIVNSFLSTGGHISAVGSIVSSGYGFISGAYMPISQFSEGLQNAIAFLPGTYGTSLLRNHAMRGVFAQMEKDGLPSQLIDGIKDAFDCNIYFFDIKVEIPVMYLILTASVLLLIGIYVILASRKNKKKS